jgi:hypothetical protein
VPRACFRARPHDIDARHVPLHSAYVPPPDATDLALHPGPLRVVAWRVALLPQPQASKLGEKHQPLLDRFVRRRHSNSTHRVPGRYPCRSNDNRATSFCLDSECVADGHTFHTRPDPAVVQRLLSQHRLLGVVEDECWCRCGLGWPGTSSNR